MKFTIYLDMDGVICDFTKQYIKVNEVPPSMENRDAKETDNKWLNFIKGKNFEKLEYFKDADILLNVVNLLTNDPVVNVEILSSSGGPSNYDEVKAQKIKWLNDHNIPYKVNIVPHRGKKKEYATEYTVLIDDTDDVIEGFTAAGGKGILHNDVYKTVEQLMKYYLDFKNSI